MQGLPWTGWQGRCTRHPEPCGAKRALSWRFDQGLQEGKRTHAALRDMAARMSEADMRNVVGYYASLPPIAPPPARLFPASFPMRTARRSPPPVPNAMVRTATRRPPACPSLAGQQPHYLVVAVQEYLNGVRKTAPMHSLLRRLNKLEVESVALYFASQTPAQRSAPSFGDPAAGEPLTADCGGCHGSHGVSTDAATPNLAGQDPQYLVNAIKSYRKTRRHEGMRAYVGDLSEQDIENIAAFYAVQKSRPAERGQTLVQELIGKCDRCHAADVENATMAVPQNQRAGQGLPDHGLTGLSRRPAREFDDAQHEPALQRLHH